MRDNLPFLDPQALPDGVVWCEQPHDMRAALLTRGTFLVLTPFQLSSTAERAVRTATLTNGMQSHLRRCGSRWRPPYQDLAVDEDPFRLAQKLVSDSLVIEPKTHALALDITKGLEIIQTALGTDLQTRLEAQNSSFHGFGHFDDSAAAGTVVLNGTPMAAFIRQTWYRLPRKAIGAWWGNGKDASGDGLYHWHGVTEPGEDLRLIVGGFSSRPIPAMIVG